MRPVILSGGAGTRLWPLSVPDRPKQFLDLIGEPLFVQALQRLDGLEGVGDPVIVTGRDHLALVEEAIERANVAVHRILVEPTGRNTAPALIAAAMSLEPAEVMVVLPADHIISDRGAFLRAVFSAVDLAAQFEMVTFGVTPDRAETGYGYIEAGEAVGDGRRVIRFKEKPDESDAHVMAFDGRHYWNSGMFVFRADALLEEARTHAPDLVDGVESAMGDTSRQVIVLGPDFERVEAISIDHAVMEFTKKAVMIPIDVGWTDVGTWHSLWEASSRDASGNVIVGDVTAIEVTGSYLSSSGRRIAVVGVDDIVVVETPDTVLIVGRDSAQKVRDLVERAGDTDRAG